MAEEDRVKRAADTLGKMAADIETSLVRDGYTDYPNKPNDRDWKRGYAQACRDGERALRE